MRAARAAEEQARRDAADERRLEVEARARAMWSALEYFLYGQSGKFTHALRALLDEQEAQAAMRMQNACRGFMGRKLTEEQRRGIAATTIQVGTPSC